MKLEISLDNDPELRKYIKELIFAEVKHIAREEFNQGVKDILEGKVSKMDDFNFQRLLKQELKNALSDILTRKDVLLWLEGQFPTELKNRIWEMTKDDDIKNRIDKGVRDQINRILTGL